MPNTTITEPVWVPGIKCLESSVVRSDGSTLRGELYLDETGVTLAMDFDFSNGDPALKEVFHGIENTALARKRFATYALTFVKQGN